ncbi:MAG TPA: sodium:solute symporter family protein [Candidatus Eisenbacteria bacterium]|nr:sodium:solute symporter family protein [Candidatus Eisenbacteria bacterium]
MKPSVVAMTIIFGTILVGAVTGMYAGFRRQMNLEQWAVAGRGFGLILVWLLMAGEIYTTFAFLGASGWAYSRGGPTLYIIAYLSLAYVVSYFILPRIWEVGHRFALHTQSDFFRQRYGSTPLAALVAVVGVLFIIPYLQLQLTGLGIIVQVASFDAVSRSMAITIAFVIVAVFVLASGIRAVAWVSVLKDSLMLIAAFSIGIGVPYYYFGGIKPMFAALIQAKAAHLTMPGSTTTMGHAWYISTVLLTSMGFYMWPHAFGSAFSAKSGDTLRRNAVIMPLYGITLPLLFFAGFAAILVTPGLKNGDMALLSTVRSTFSPWFLGMVGGAGALTAMVPAAILILTAGTLFAKNFFRPLFAPAMSDDAVARLAKAMVVVITAVAMYFAIFSSSTLVGLLLFAYSGVTQFFPGVVLGLFWKRTTAPGVAAGIITGVGAGMALVFTKHDPYMGLNAGFIALCLNAAVTVIVSLATLAQPDGFAEQLEKAAGAEFVS